MTVDRDLTRRAAAELVVEDLQREQSIESGGGERIHEIVEGKVALAGEIPEVPAPRQVVHVEPGRVGGLNEEDAVARDGADGGEVGATRQDVKVIEHQTNRRMIGAANGLPGAALVVDVPAPGQPLEGAPHAAAGGTVTQLAQVGGGAVDA